MFVRCKGFKLNLYSPSRTIIKGRKVGPNFSVDVDGFGIFLNFLSDMQQGALVAKLSISLTHVMMLDSCRTSKNRESRVAVQDRSREASDDGVGGV